MSNHGFDANRATWSSPHGDSTPADSQCPSVDPITGTCNCTDVYTDWARQSDLNAVGSAFGGGLIGVSNATASSGLWCGGMVSGMLQVPIYHTQPDIVDVHMYPHVAGAGSGDTQVQQVATLDFNDLTHFLPLVYPNGPTPLFMIGETHSGTPVLQTDVSYQGSEVVCPYAPAFLNGQTDTSAYPATAAASEVAGFNQSSLAGYNVIFRPWMELQDATGQCYPYSTYQNVNLNWDGPYAPSQH
jgi:hypothetical protein